MKSVSVFRLSGRLFIHPNKRTTDGVWLSRPSFVSLPLESTDEKIGETILALLEQSVGVVPHPRDWAGISKPRLDAAGVRTESAFMKGAKLVDVGLDGDMSLAPQHNGGARGELRGFSPIPEARMAISAASSPSEIGAALASAFLVCTGVA